MDSNQGSEFDAHDDLDAIEADLDHDAGVDLEDIEAGVSNDTKKPDDPKDDANKAPRAPLPGMNLAELSAVMEMQQAREKTEAAKGRTDALYKQHAVEAEYSEFDRQGWSEAIHKIETSEYIARKLYTARTLQLPEYVRKLDLARKKYDNISQDIEASLISLATPLLNFEGQDEFPDPDAQEKEILRIQAENAFKDQRGKIEKSFIAHKKLDRHGVRAEFDRSKWNEAMVAVGDKMSQLDPANVDGMFTSLTSAEYREKFSDILQEAEQIATKIEANIVLLQNMEGNIDPALL
ncbi:uncharacterized protein SEPMUDRAFT_145875 [Sphaerulina musiva SO2202]|uniref:Uncharacterized protein n=1 Tax=Sphaerulina musiva (strain SO2202) TaxID=692275 RepID=N1QHJ0_SPHMS|nr:uncharacterized protein SEPMUDRAFT_145875 [Sphaerulina musiva SO2202]EMF16686.1 hypothetical protein SEPMUDRAFT_145875 [Sphaerulina musiva SO2202]